MKLSYLTLLGAAVALPLGIYLTYRAGDAPDPQAVSASVSLPAPVTQEAIEPPAVADNGRTADGTQRDMAALKEEVGILRAEVSALRRAVREQARTLAQAGAGAEENQAAKDPSTEAATREDEEWRHQERMATVEADFRREPAATPWSIQTEAAVQEALAGDEAARTAVRSVECRSHTCRVEVTDDNSRGLAKFIPLLSLQLAQTLPNMNMMSTQVEDGADGKVTILYLVSE